MEKGQGAQSAQAQAASSPGQPSKPPHTEIVQDRFSGPGTCTCLHEQMCITQKRCCTRVDAAALMRGKTTSGSIVPGRKRRPVCV